MTKKQTTVDSGLRYIQADHQMEWTRPTLVEQLVGGSAKVAVVGLNRRGLSTALALAKDINVLAYDSSATRVESLRSGNDPSRRFSKSAFDKKQVTFTTAESQLESARVYVVTASTTVDSSNAPDLTALKTATMVVAKNLAIGDYVVFETTVYPGCTEEVCLPILEKVSGLTLGTEFRLAYVPSRSPQESREVGGEPLDRVVSATDLATCQEVGGLYAHLNGGRVHMASSIRMAEAAKLVENTQRDVNIALMNELSIIFEKMDLDTSEVLALAATKWNFMPFAPGFVGGDGVAIDPYYLIHSARKHNVDADVMKSARMINDWMPYEIVHRVYDELKKANKVLDGARILVMGCTYKPNVSGVLNSKAAEMVNILVAKHADVDVCDPVADEAELDRRYDITLCEAPKTDYDVVIMAVDHWEYKGWKSSDFSQSFAEDTIVFDVSGSVVNDSQRAVSTL